MIKLCTRQIVETSTHMTSTANMEIIRRGINMLYPPVGQLAVAAAEAAAAAAAAALAVSWAAAAAAAVASSLVMMMMKATQM